MTDLTPYQLALIRDSLGQSGSPQGAMLAGGLAIGSNLVPPAAGDLTLEGSIRQSVAISAGLTMLTAQSVPNAAWTAAVMDTVNWDSDGCVNLAANPGRLTVNTGGVYVLACYAEWTAAANGIRLVSIRYNNFLFVSKSSSDVVAGNNSHSGCACLWFANPGDYFEFMLYQSSGAALALQSYNSCRPNFTMARIA